MNRPASLKILAMIATAGALALVGSPALAAPGGGSYTCAGGDIPSGHYSSVTVTGDCGIEVGATIDIARNLEVADGAALRGDLVASTITIGRNVTAGEGSYLALGCQPSSLVGNTGHACWGMATSPEEEPQDVSEVRIGGNVSATGAESVALNGVEVARNVTLRGGGGAFTYWPIKNNSIGGNVTIDGVTAEWIGVMFNVVDGNVTLTDITSVDSHPFADPVVYIVKNQIGRNLTCSNLVHGVSGGFDPTGVNVVGRNANGQCAGLV
ncbi:hypothetical protein [Agromyces marinus]|uniref:Right handed beta helix region n=1 Tax=Agromyces marinus TaxID=1389020 RepID=A0ABN6YFJ2_9MICO|nr:hypothetical protein [Agromyces marinus]UIP59044.1 hypothetical protein DSM26151_19380 [Agromyces marinus]BDZ55978.1 hypothetical protein GCM10025870_30510 [Agromyces marinus]